MTWTIKWEPRDLWVGLFWDRRADGMHYYVCVIPCVVLHIIRKHQERTE